MPTFRSMTTEEGIACDALAKLSLSKGTHERSLADSLIRQSRSPLPQITDKQAASLWRLCWTHRARLPVDVRALAKKNHMDGVPPQAVVGGRSRADASPAT